MRKHKRIEVLNNEERRIDALNHYRVAGTGPEELFDHYVQMATLIFRVPAAMITFIDNTRAQCKASIGIGTIEDSGRYKNVCMETIKTAGIYEAGITTNGESSALSAYTYYIGAPIFAPGGHAIGCLGLLNNKDHTLSASQLELLKIFSSAIMDAVEDRLKNLEENESHLELMRQKDDFISVASHELRTPITIIKSYAQIIKKEVNQHKYKKDLGLFTERIEKQSEKLLALVENLLDRSRIEMGLLAFCPETFDFVKLLEQVLEELDATNTSHSVEIAGEETLYVYADRFRIGQVLTNLISNAIKYSPRANKVVINCYKNSNNNLATISVQDFGKGIAPEYHEKLFKKFYRIIDVQETQVLGTGLGLNIAQEIIKQHGGTIAINSELGKGATFSFDLQLSTLEVLMNQIV